MPKGGKKRTKEEYEEEIEDAVKRFKKYPERLRYAGSSSEWQEFLSNIGIVQSSINGGSDFWEGVREKTIAKIPAVRTYENRTVYRETYQERMIYREVYSEIKTIYRDPRTGRFVSRNILRKS